MKKSPSEMTSAELRQYLSEHRNEEAIFSEALEVLLSRKKTVLNMHLKRCRIKK
jgi:hypothetical protein